MLSVKAFCNMEYVAWHIYLCYSDPFWHYLRVFCSLLAVGCACSPTEPIPTTHFCSGPSRCIFRLAACVWLIRMSLFRILSQYYLIFFCFRRDFLGGFSRVFPTWDSKGAKDCKSCRSRTMLQNAYLDAKIGFDAEENEPSKVW